MHEVSGERSKGIGRGLEPVVHCVVLAAYHSIALGSGFPMVGLEFGHVQGVLSRGLLADK